MRVDTLPVLYCIVSCLHQTLVAFKSAPSPHLHRTSKSNSGTSFWQCTQKISHQAVSYYSSVWTSLLRASQRHCWKQSHWFDLTSCYQIKRWKQASILPFSVFLFCLFHSGNQLWLGNEPFWNEASVTCVCAALRAIGGLRTICLSLGWVMCVCLWLQPGPGWSHQSPQPWGWLSQRGLKGVRVIGLRVGEK